MANSSTFPSKPGRTKEVKNGAGRPIGADLHGPTSSSTAAPTYDDIARRAFEIYEREGRQPGRDLENWLQAEIELGLRSESH
jgi:hypothetical protein